MAGLGQAAAGAAGGFAAGGPIGAAIGGIAGLIGGGRPQEDPLTRQMRQMQANAAQQEYQYATGVPGSDPGEQAALASERGMLGQAQRNAMQGAFANWLPGQGSANTADMARNLASIFTGQQMSLQESHLANALAQRRQALMDAANIAGRGAQTGPVYQPQSDLPQVLGQVAQMVAYQRALKQGRNQGGSGAVGTSGASGGGSGMPQPTTPQYPGFGGNYGSPGFGSVGSGAVPGSTPGSSSAIPALADAGLYPTSNPIPGLAAAGLYPTSNPVPGLAAAGLYPDATTPGVGPGSQPANAAQGTFAPPAPSNAPQGLNGLNNQIRQTQMGLGLTYPTPQLPWQQIANMGLGY